MEGGPACRELRGAAAIPGLGFWDWDIRGDSLVWSDELLAMFGLSQQPSVAS